jgi:phosphoglycerol transferase MdoB-like AlkP superfamily enzyme
MITIKRFLKPIFLILLLGLLQRLLLSVLCFSRFESVGDIIIACVVGLIYDLSYASVILIIYIWLKNFFSTRSIELCFLIFIYVWVVLNAVDFFSLAFTGVRTNINSFDLFSFGDLLDKSGELKIWLPFLLFNVLFLYLLFKIRKMLLPDLNEIKLRERGFITLMLMAGSLIYLPYPFNYYSNKIKISGESKQLALNPYYSWIVSLINSSESYVMNKDIALSSFKKKMGYSGEGVDFIIRKVNYKDSAYNEIILVVMESFGANRVGKLGGEKDLSPNFDSLCAEGVLYTKCFACGPRTQYGISSILFGFPHILGYNLFRQNKLRVPFKGLISSISQSGYRTHFLHGGRASYDDMNLLLEADNISQIRDKEDINSYKFKNVWGVDDESFFGFSNNYIASQQGKNLFCLLTMSNHEPFELPKDFKCPSYLKESEKTFYYSDYALGQFIKKLKSSKRFQNSLIIVTGDHGERYSDSDDQTKLFHVPLLIIDHKRRGVKEDKICSHSDIAEYILSKTKYSGKTHFIGQGLTNKDKRQVYYRDYDNNIFKVTDSTLYRYSLLDKSLYKIYCKSNMYVVSKEIVASGNELYKTVANDITSYYTANKFIFQAGLYK